MLRTANQSEEPRLRKLLTLDFPGLRCGVVSEVMLRDDR